MIKERLVEHFRSAPSAPFLFVGSGFSRRYLQLEDWTGLLKRFACDVRPFEYYLSSAAGHLPTVATLLANDLHDVWWTSSKYEASRDKHKTKVRDRTSALRFEICNYLNSLSISSALGGEHKDEIALLSKLNVDGIITTNWDLLLEKLFPDYRVFVGQGELLFANPQSIAEIYKIHGCVLRPSSLVLTQEDYNDFDRKNPYLAAKLITLFVEHPVVFIGYSLTDANICSLLKSITAVLGEENLGKLGNNLIFVQRAKGMEDQYSDTYMAIDGGRIPITIVKTDSLIPVYEALDAVKRRIPARVLRYCKEQLYELVTSTSPEEKLCVMDIDEIDAKKDVEFVVGVGVASAAQKPAPFGYIGISALDLFADLVFDDKGFDPKLIVEQTLPEIGRSSPYIPVFKYLAMLGISSLSSYKKFGADLSRHMPSGSNHYVSNAYTKPFLRTEKSKDAAEIISSNPPEKAAIFLAFLTKEKFDLTIVQEFLRNNSEKFDNANSNYSTFFRKLACRFDFERYGWTTTKAKGP